MTYDQASQAFEVSKPSIAKILQKERARLEVERNLEYKKSMEDFQRKCAEIQAQQSAVPTQPSN
jgi:hypothetical protein